jgi:hypothetical protein
VAATPNAGNALLARAVAAGYPPPGLPPGAATSNAALARALAGRTPQILRVIDPAKAEPIRKEIDTFGCKTLGMTGDLEKLWAGLGKDLPEAVNHPAFADLWRTSTIERKMDIDAAAKPLRNAFERDTREAARQMANDKRMGFEHLRKDIQKAEQQKQTKLGDEASGGIDDEKAKTSRLAGGRRFEVRDLVDTATLVDFLENWETMLRRVPVGSHSVDGFQPLGAPGQAPGSPGAPSGGFNPLPGPGPTPSPTPAPGAPPTIGEDGSLQIMFDPNANREQILRLAERVHLDEDRMAILKTVHSKCSERKADFKQLAAALVEEDVNLKALKDQNLLGQVSALGGQDDKTASSALSKTVAGNIEKLDLFLGSVDKTDWLALRPIHERLLSGASHGSSGIKWSDFVEREFMMGYFKREGEARRAEAERQMYAQLALTALTFIALLSPAAPLAMAVLATADILAAADAVKGVGEGKKAAQRADNVEKAADVGAATKDDADAARREANEKNSHAAMDLMLAVMPFVPGALKRGGRFASLSDESMAALRAFNADQRGAIRTDVLITAGLSAAASRKVGGTLSLEQVLAKIHGGTNSTGWYTVGASLERGGDEKLLRAGSKYGLTDYVRYHIIGPGTGHEVYPILLAPGSANAFTNNHIEGFMRTHRDRGATVRFAVTYASYGGEELRPWLKEIFEARDPDIINRIALDQGRIEHFLKTATYEIEVVDGTTTQLYRANVTLPLPGSGGAVTQIAPQRVR